MLKRKSKEIVPIDFLVTIHDREKTEFKLNLEIDRNDVAGFTKMIQKFLVMAQAAPMILKALLAKFG